MKNPPTRCKSGVLHGSNATLHLHIHPLQAHSIDIRALCLDLGSYGNRSTRFRDFVVGICESREY